MSLRRVVHGVMVLCMAAWLTVSAVASEYHGQVTFSGLPLPGSTVTVTATQGDKKSVAVSDDQGVFAFPDLADGTWTLTIEMTGFAPLKQQVTIAPNVQSATFELKLLSLDQIRAEDKPVKVDMTLLAGAQPSTASSTAGGPQVAGANPPAAPSAASQKASDGVLINGSQSNAATSQFSMNQAFGNTRNHRSLYNGNVLLTLDNSALDAAPYNIAGTPEPRPQFNNYTLGFTVGGPLNIPHLMPRGPYFQLSYSHSQSSNYQTLNELVPTGEQADKSWQLSSGPVFVPANLAAVAPMCSSYLAANPNATTPDPSTPSTGKLVFKNNVIPASCVTPASTVLLNQYPAANVTGNSVYNYQIPQNNSTVSDSFSISLQKQLGNKNNLSGRFNYLNSRGNNINPNIFSFLDTNAALGMNVSVAWRHTISQRFYSSMTYSFGRQRTQVLPSFSNIETQANISGAIPATAYNGQYQGPPKLNFSSSIAGFNDSVLSNNRNENNTLKEDLNWYHGNHTIQFGGVFSRLEFNYLTETNPNGTLGFTGAATQATVQSTSGTTTSTVGGSDLADFLLGIPDTSAIAYGNADKYLRQSTYALYVNDDFRVNPELSLNAGLRWEYGSPVSELKGRLVNLDVGQNFSSAIPVTGGNPLLRPDYSRPEPNISLSWRPISGSSLLIKSAYQMANDTSVYQQAAYEMAQQAPLSTSLSLQNGVGCQLSITSPFPTTGCGTTPATFAIDPNFRVGYVQVWNLQLQRDLPFSMQMVADYDGTKGTHGVQEFLPNTCPPGVTCNGNHGYIYRTSNGNLEREAGWIQLRRRPRNGFEASVIYTFAKSLDDYYSLGGQGSVTNTSALAQDWTNLRGQRGLSITDQRHLVNVVAQYTTGMGIGGKALLSGWRGAIYKEWSIKTVFSAGSGLPETPIYGAATASGTGFSGTIRPDVVGSPYTNLTAGRFLNPNAYAAPAAGYGNARRDSIEGPHTFSLNANMLRTFRLRGRRSLNAQISATNVLNHVVFTQWNTVWIPPSTSGSSTTSTPNSSFGAPESPNGMRSVSLSLRMEF